MGKYPTINLSTFKSNVYKLILISFIFNCLLWKWNELQHKLIADRCYDCFCWPVNVCIDGKMWRVEQDYGTSSPDWSSDVSFGLHHTFISHEHISCYKILIFLYMPSCHIRKFCERSLTAKLSTSLLCPNLFKFMKPVSNVFSHHFLLKHEPYVIPKFQTYFIAFLPLLKVWLFC